MDDGPIISSYHVTSVGNQEANAQEEFEAIHGKQVKLWASSSTLFKSCLIHLRTTRRISSFLPSAGHITVVLLSLVFYIFVYLLLSYQYPFLSTSLHHINFIRDIWRKLPYQAMLSILLLTAWERSTENHTKSTSGFYPFPLSQSVYYFSLVEQNEQTQQTSFWEKESEKITFKYIFLLQLLISHAFY